MKGIRPGNENVPTQGRATKMKRTIEVINVESSDSESDTQVPTGGDYTNGEDIKPLIDTINHHRKVATKIRLTRKTEMSVPEKTKEFLKLREASRQQDPSKLSSILFKCEVNLQKRTGQKQGTRVPMQTRGFLPNEVLLFSSIFSLFIRSFVNNYIEDSRHFQQAYHHV